MNDNRAVVHNFGEDLEWSAKLSDEPAWAHYYKRLFPSLAASVAVRRDSGLQRQGVDRILHFPSGLQLTVDEKKRKSTDKNGNPYLDILLERWSDQERAKPGWTLDPDKLCDYIAYAIPLAQRCYFLPYPLLREAFRQNLNHWVSCYGQIPVQNKGWTTINVPVPWSELKERLSQQMLRKYTGELELPVLQTGVETTDDQLSLVFPDNT